MSISATTHRQPAFDALRAFGAFYREGQRRQPLLWGFAVVMAALVVPTAAALAVDARELNGINVWVKILKFEVSLAVFFGTVAWFYDALAADRREGRVLGAFSHAAVGAACFEIGYMILQAARGTASHFNVSTPLEAFLFQLMGVGAVVIASLALALAVAIARNGRTDLAPAFRLSIVLGLGLSFVLGVGAGMVIGGNGSHWVGGVATDAGGLPIFGWSRSGGDLRVAHFFGLHAMQFVPLVGWFVGRRHPRTTWPVWAAAGAVTVLTVFTLWQALQGQPFPGLPG